MVRTLVICLVLCAVALAVLAVEPDIDLRVAALFYVAPDHFAADTPVGRVVRDVAWFGPFVLLAGLALSSLARASPALAATVRARRAQPALRRPQLRAVARPLRLRHVQAAGAPPAAAQRQRLRRSGHFPPSGAASTAPAPIPVRSRRARRPAHCGLSRRRASCRRPGAARPSARRSSSARRRGSCASPSAATFYPTCSARPFSRCCRFWPRAGWCGRVPTGDACHREERHLRAEASCLREARLVHIPPCTLPAALHARSGAAR